MGDLEDGDSNQNSSLGRSLDYSVDVRIKQQLGEEEKRYLGQSGCRISEVEIPEYLDDVCSKKRIKTAAISFDRRLPARPWQPVQRRAAVVVMENYSPYQPSSSRLIFAFKMERI
ncbi:hypothetical protein TWF706_011252 [Orbilia oligospora]|nr:hypothetical protein TWF706_011252 [Orbilia oligospora]